MAISHSKLRRKLVKINYRSSEVLYENDVRTIVIPTVQAWYIGTTAYVVLHLKSVTDGQSIACLLFVFKAEQKAVRLFQVETIGDAYMVISGSPDELVTHAERVANTALGMLHMSTQLRSPYDYGDRSKSVKVKCSTSQMLKNTWMEYCPVFCT